MIEETKIQDVIKKYQNFFETTTADVTESIKGEHFFYLKDEISGEIYYILKFHTATELEKIIIYEMIDNLNMVIETGIETLDKEINLYDTTSPYCKLDNAVNRLIKILEAIQIEQHKWGSKIQTSLIGLNTYISKHKGPHSL